MMSLDEIKHCCLQLDSDKVTDRKKGCEQLRHLLNNANIVAILDSRPGDAFNWNQVFYSAKSFFLKEARRVEDEERKKPDPSQTVLSNRINQKRAAAALPKLVLNKSSLKTPHVTARSVIELVNLVLDRGRPYLLENFAGDVIQIVMKYVLRFPQYYLELQPEHLKDLMKSCIWVYDHGLPNCDATTIVTVMEGIVRCSVKRGSQQRTFLPVIVLRPLPSFLKRSLDNNRLTSQYGLQSGLLSLLHTFTKAMGKEWRCLVCSIGEDTFDSVLAMWETRSSSRQNKLLEYLNLLILMHHPQKDGMLTEESSLVHDSDGWQRCLRRLYQTVHDHLNDLAVKNKLASGSSFSSEQQIIPHNLVILAARLCHKVFQDVDSVGVLDVTQANITQVPSQSVGNSQDGRPTKRRKIAVGLHPVTDMLREEGSSQHTIPWYQILHEMLKCYSSYFTLEKCLLLLDLFTTLLAECKVATVQEYILRCLAVLAVQHNSVTTPFEAKDDKRSGRWLPVWDLTLRLVSGKQCVEPGLELLQTLMKTKLIHPDGSIFRLFHQGYVEMSETALTTLKVLLTTVPLPKLFRCDAAVFAEDRRRDARESLLQFLLPLQTDAGAVNSIIAVLKYVENPSLLAEVLLVLRHRDSRYAADELKKISPRDFEVLSYQDEPGCAESMEALYLTSTFCSDLPGSSPLKENVIKNAKCTDFRIIQEEEEKLVERVMKFIDQVVNDDLQSCPKGVLLLAHLLELIAMLLSCINDRRLEVKLSMVMSKVSIGVSIVIAESETSRWTNLLPVLQKLNYLYFQVDGFARRSQDPVLAKNGQHLWKVLASSVPPQMLKLMLDMITSRTVKSPNNSQLGVSQNNGSGRNSSLGNGASFDLDIDELDSGPSLEVKDDFVKFEEDNANDTLSGNKEQVKLNDVRTFSVRDQCIVIALQWIIHACNPPTSDFDEENSPLLDAISLVQEMAELPSLDTSDIGVILSFVSVLFNTGYNEDNILDDFNILSILCKKHASNPKVASCVFSILAGLVRSNGVHFSATVKQCLFNITQGCAQVQYDSVVGEGVDESLLTLNAELTKLDPLRKWSRYVVKDNNRVAELFSLLCSPSHELRIMAARSVYHLIVSENSTDFDTRHLNDIFKEVYQVCLEALIVQGSVYEEFKPDEGSNRVATLLITLGVIIQNCSYLEAKAVFALCLAVAERGVDSSLVARLLRRITSSRPTSVRAFMRGHLPYMIEQWIQHERGIMEFPPCLLECRTQKDFLSQNIDILLPALLHCNQFPTVEEVASLCGSSAVELLKTNFATLMAHIFPYLAAEDIAEVDQQLSGAKIQAAKKRYKIIQKAIGEDDCRTLMDKHLGDITLCLVKLVHSQEPMVAGEVIVAPNPPYFSPVVIKKTLENLGQLASELDDDNILVGSNIGPVLAQRGRMLNCVVVGVMGYLARSDTPHSARLALSSVAAVVDMLVPYIQNQLKKVSEYVVRMLVHTLTYYTSSLYKIAPYLADRCNEILLNVCSATLEGCPTSLILVVQPLVARLLPHARKTSKINKSTLQVLNFIFTTDHPDLQKALTRLPPFPEDDDYEALGSLRDKHGQLVETWHGNRSLQAEVEIFLSQSPAQTDIHSVTNLLKLVQDRRIEVKKLYVKMENDLESTGHQLTHCLVALASSGKEEVAIAASKCLGELGAISLGSPVFHIQDKDHLKYEDLGNPDLIIGAHVITTLNRYLSWEPIDVVEAASCALQNVLSTREGYSALQNIEKSVQQEILPFLPRNKPKVNSSGYTEVDESGYEERMGDSDLWLCKGSYEDWVMRLTCALLEAGCGSPLLAAVEPLCKVKPEFSAFVMPYIIYSALKTDSIGRKEILSRQFSVFFSHHAEDNASGSANIWMNKAAIQVLLSVINYLRIQTPERSSRGGNKTPWEKNTWLRLNYCHVAEAAHYCGAHFSALLFIQLYCESVLSEAMSSGSSSLADRQVSPLHRISCLPQAASINRLLLQVYNCLGESDSVEGCGGGSKMMTSSARALRYQHQGKWMEVLAIYDAANSSTDMIGGLRRLGFFNTLSTFLTATKSELPQELSDAQWESAWRLSLWDSIEFGGKFGEEDCISSGGKKNGNFHQHLFHTLQSLHHQDSSTLHQQIYKARQGVISQLKLNRTESSSSIYPLLSQLQILSEVEAASKCLNENGQTEFKECLQDLVDIWSSKDASETEYSYKEPVLAGRISTLQSLLGIRKEPLIESILHKTLLAKSLLSRENQKLGCGQGSELALSTAFKLKLSHNLTWMTRLEEAHVARCYGDAHQASQVLKTLLEDMEEVNLEHSEQRIFCEALNLYGSVLLDSRARPPQIIIKDYFCKAIQHLEEKDDMESGKILENSYHQLATYGDKLYREIHQYLESDTIQAKRENISSSENEINRVRNVAESCRDEIEKKELTRKLTILIKNINIDRDVLQDLEKQQEEYVYLTLKNYLKCLIISQEHDLHMYRVVALWLEHLTETKINELIYESGGAVKSYKFVPLIYQLVARLTCQKNKYAIFSKVLFKLLERVCKEHPHHCLPVILALAFAHADDEILKRSSSNTMRKGSQVIEEDRVQAAKILVNSLKKTRLAEHISELERICVAYLTFANWCGTKEKMKPGAKVEIPNSQPLAKLRNMSHTAALTRPLMLQPSASYNPPLIQGWENTCAYVGGINAPKRLSVKTSDGLQQFELLKGRDDIRQDAVMEQVFGIVNQLLLKNKETRERMLSIRTYQVVPLSQKSGLIQWCNNTQSFGEYLIGPSRNSGAHKLYYPDDYTATTCKEKMLSVKTKSREVRGEVFQDILKNFHPVFRHFFFENYPSPHEWYKRRLAYSRSVATTSMVGYILGLGDRHVENILLDKSTAELIHIDLGIAFDLGKILPTPETVPFRLTQDIVDGLGVMGVEGPLRRCSEATLSVLRNSGEVLVTVVEVLRHDPLHQWTLSPQQVARLQASEDEEQGIGVVSSASMADRVVLRLQQKLSGVEDGYARSVPEQVTVLIQQAMDHSNLSLLFPGWQPYL